METTSNESKKTAPSKRKSGQSVESGGNNVGKLDQAAMTLDDLERLLQLLSTNNVTEFELERSAERLVLKRGGAVATSYVAVSEALPVAAPVTAAVPAVVAASPVAAPAAQTGSTNGQPATPLKKYNEISSPMVGTFYRRPAIDAEPFVEIGDFVKKGDVLCIVEAMKLMNEIESEISGKVVEICLDDAQMVEYGEVLFRIDPSAS